MKTLVPINKLDSVEAILERHKGNGGDEPPMELLQRVERLESTLHEVKVDTAVIKSNYATKHDVSEMKNSLILWFVSALGASFLTLAGIMVKGFGWL